jgi:UDP-N-acetylglucosamine--N-acetylmuramyl-(pentapeptide) pyrophosphoryl-undecaprenol N-acetylglucosamine transferase
MENSYMIAAGGSGGHFYPGFALAKQLAERGRDVVVVIKKGSSCADLLLKADMNFYEADAVAMPRGKNIFKWITFIFRLFSNILKMRKALKEYKPEVCIGMGGYISFPLIFAAYSMGIKTVLHDSNAKIGLANRVCAKFADLFLLGLPCANNIARAVLVGTPVREEFRLKESEADRNYWQFATDFGINILIFGGSQGARSLNEAAVKMAENILAKTNRVHFLHITGRRDYGAIKALYKNGKNIEIIEYSEEIYSLMQAAHLIISRSGAGSLAEIICLKKPSILIPYPFASDNHQYYNAKVLADAGCALMLRETPSLAEDLSETVKNLMASPETFKAIRSNFDAAGFPDPLEAASRCAELIENISK